MYGCHLNDKLTCSLVLRNLRVAC